MNSVHEHCPKSDSETVLSQKLCQVHRAPNLAQPAHAGAPRCACACRAVGCCGCVVSVAPTVSQVQGAVSQRAVPRAWLPCPGLAVLYCNTAHPFSLVPCHNTPRCIVIQRPTKPAPQSQYNKCIATQCPAA